MEKKTGEYKGVALYGSGGKLSCMPDSRTMLIGSDRSVKAAIDGNGKEFTHSKFQFARGSGNVVIAALRTSSPSSSLSKKSSFPTTSFPPGSPFDASRKVGELLDQHTRGGYLVVNVGTRVDFSGGVLCNDDAGAASLDQELKTVLDNGRKQIESLKSIAAVSAMSVPLISVMDSLVVSRSGSTVSVSGTVEQSLIDALQSSGMTPATQYGSPMP